MQMRKLAIGLVAAAGLLLGGCDAKDGESGPVGGQGPVGDKGATGATGQTGPKGPTGDAGAKGATGDTGATGIDGDCVDSEPLEIVGFSGLEDFYILGGAAPTFTVDVETADGTAVTDLTVTYITNGPELTAGATPVQFTLPATDAGDFIYFFYVTDGCHIAEGQAFVTFEPFVAYLSIVHVSARAGDVGVALSGTTDRTDLSYLDVTAHMPLSLASAQFDILDGDDDVLTTTDALTFEYGEFYTIIAYDDQDGGFSIGLLHDDLTPVADDDTDFRLQAFHAAPGAGVVDITNRDASDAVIFNDLAFGTLSSEAPELPVGDYSLGVDKGANGSVDFTLDFSTGGPTDPVIAGEIATAFAIAGGGLMLIRAAAPGVGTTFAATVAIDGSTMTPNAVVGEGSLAPVSPAPLGLAIASGSLTYTRTLTVAGCGTVFYATVGVDIPHAYRGDLQITLTAPNGATVVLNASNFGDGADDFVGRFVDGGGAVVDGVQTYAPSQPLAGLIGLGGSGDWQLTVTDTYPSDDDGVLNGWGLNLVCL